MIIATEDWKDYARTDEESEWVSKVVWFGSNSTNTGLSFWFVTFYIAWQALLLEYNFNVYSRSGILKTNNHFSNNHLPSSLCSEIRHKVSKLILMKLYYYYYVVLFFELDACMCMLCPWKLLIRETLCQK
jgi:hypothetical protein